MLPRQAAVGLMAKRHSGRTVIASLLPYLLLLALPTTVSAQPSLTLRANPVKDALLVQVLNGGEMQDLNKLGPAKHKGLAIRLYGVAHSGSCVEETEWVCSYRYVLAVSEYGEEPEQAAYHLGEVGEIGAIRWLETSGSDHAVLEVEVRSYPEHASKQNQKLRLQRQRYRLDVSLRGVTITPAK